MSLFDPDQVNWWAERRPNKRRNKYSDERGKFDIKHLRPGASLFAVALVELGRLDEAKSEVKAAPVLNSNFTPPNFTLGAIGMRKAAAPEE